MNSQVSSTRLKKLEFPLCTIITSYWAMLYSTPGFDYPVITQQRSSWPDKLVCTLRESDDVLTIM